MGEARAWPGGRLDRAWARLSARTQCEQPWPGPAPQTEGKVAPWRETGTGAPGLEGRREVPRDTTGKRDPQRERGNSETDQVAD